MPLSFLNLLSLFPLSFRVTSLESRRVPSPRLSRRGEKSYRVRIGIEKRSANNVQYYGKGMRDRYYFVMGVWQLREGRGMNHF
jgi:hypothetical protein